jgi:hypothetical protein
MAVVEHHQTPLANYDRVFHSAPDRSPYLYSFSLFMRSVSRESFSFDTVFITRFSFEPTPMQRACATVNQLLSMLLSLDFVPATF